jgi:hypothetical protein
MVSGTFVCELASCQTKEDADGSQSQENKKSKAGLGPHPGTNLHKLTSQFSWL